MKFITILLMILPIMLTAAEDLPLPKDVVKAVKSHTKDVDKANAELEKALAKANDKLVKVIEDAIDDSKDMKSYEGFKAALTDEQIVENTGIDEKVRELAALHIKLKEVVGDKEKVSLFGQKKEKKVNMKGGKPMSVSAAWGKEIQSVKKGYSIHIQYVDGSWRSPSETDMENPNETDKSHLKLTLYGRVNKDNKFEALKVINDSSEVVTFEFASDYDMIMLAPQINTGPVPNWNVMHQNSGAVEVKVAFSK